MIGSASAQWAVTAPIFVPMLMLVGYAPEVIQAAYRIGDSVTNIITPMMSYFGLIMATVIKYKRCGRGYADFYDVAVFRFLLDCVDCLILHLGICFGPARRSQRAHILSRTLNTINKMPSENLFAVFRRHLPFHPSGCSSPFPFFRCGKRVGKQAGEVFKQGLFEWVLACVAEHEGDFGIVFLPFADFVAVIGGLGFFRAASQSCFWANASAAASEVLAKNGSGRFCPILKNAIHSDNSCNALSCAISANISVSPDWTIKVCRVSASDGITAQNIRCSSRKAIRCGALGLP